VRGMQLIVVSVLKAKVQPNGKLLLTRKFVDGMSLYEDLWKGPVTLLCEPSDQASDNLDNTEVDRDKAPFRTVCVPFSDAVLHRLFESRSLVLASADGPFDGASGVCRSAGVPCVYVTEYSLKTRLEIAREHRRTVLQGWRRSWWEQRKERSLRKAISISSGVQCNGTPTYRSYRTLTPRPMLFFDSRVEETMQARPEQVEDRWSAFRRDRTLRLLFSGRLNLMKGADHLPLVAAHLRKLGLPFEMSICGDGDLAPALRAAVEGLKLTGCVTFRGVLDFKTQLVPRVTRETDLFVCCHRQGDPSCTYLETLSCGVPIAGYANEALRGLVETSGVGWLTPLDRPIALAEKIASIYSHPEELKAASLRSLAFARDHTFEKTFRRRIEHLNQVSESCSALTENSGGPAGPPRGVAA